MLLIVSVTDSEDVSTSIGEFVTMYIVNVQYSSKSSYILGKRYSEFKSLFEVTKHLLPNHYKFPNKSMFSNSAQSTKERRIKGFDELLKLLTKQEQLAPSVEQFLGISERISNPFKIARRVRSSSSNANDRLRTSSREFASNDRRNEKEEDLVAKNNASNSTLTTTIRADAIMDKNNEINTENVDNKVIKDNVPYILFSSMQIAAAIYIVSIILKIIDISKSSYLRVVFAMISFGLLITLVRIIYSRAWMLLKN